MKRKSVKSKMCTAKTAEMWEFSGGVQLAMENDYSLFSENSVINTVDEEKRYVYHFFKRLTDILLSLFAITVFAIPMLIIIICIKIESPGSAFYTQKRVGKNGKIFTMYKLRSMYNGSDKKLKKLKSQNLNEADGPIFKIKDDPRITKMGKFIRKTSIDELPQVINVLKGDMTVVGPRPALESEVKQYNDYQRQRLLVTPGLTCYWQVSGRSDIGFDEWVELDLKYINHHNFWIDTKLILMTFPAVIFGKGAY